MKILWRHFQTNKTEKIGYQKILKRNPKACSLDKRKMILDRKSKMQGQMKYNGEDEYVGKSKLILTM